MTTKKLLRSKRHGDVGQAASGNVRLQGMTRARIESPGTSKVPGVRPQLRIRIPLNATTAMGPGKADLLEHIAETGSISAAARLMRMSYKRAWTLVDDMNRSFKTSLVVSASGGLRGGGATLTATGKRVLMLYRTIEEKCAGGVRRELTALARLTGQ